LIEGNTGSVVSNNTANTGNGFYNALWATSSINGRFINNMLLSGGVFHDSGSNNTYINNTIINGNPFTFAAFNIDEARVRLFNNTIIGFNGSEGLYIVDAKDPTNPILLNHIPTSQLGGMSPGVVFAVGNLLVMMQNTGNIYVTMDISDPAQPVMERGRNLPPLRFTFHKTQQINWGQS